MKNNYKLGQISSDRWREYKALRLEALKEEPQAFAMKYEDEIKQPDSVWIERLKPKDDTAGVRLFLEIDGELVGMVSSYRPAEKPETAEIINVYIKANYRGSGLGKELVKSIIEKLKKADGIEKLQLAVNCNQLAALRTYESLGFKTVSRLKESIEYNGKKYDELEMELIVCPGRGD